MLGGQRGDCPNRCINPRCIWQRLGRWTWVAGVRSLPEYTIRVDCINRRPSGRQYRRSHKVEALKQAAPPVGLKIATVVGVRVCHGHRVHWNCDCAKQQHANRKRCGPPDCSRLYHFVIPVWSTKAAHSVKMRHWKIIADNLSKGGWSWGCVSALDSEGRTIWIGPHALQAVIRQQSARSPNRTPVLPDEPGELSLDRN